MTPFGVILSEVPMKSGRVEESRFSPKSHFAIHNFQRIIQGLWVIFVKI